MKEGIKAVHPLMNRVERAEGAKIGVSSDGSNHHIPFTGRSTGGYRTIKMWKSPRKIRATEFDFVDISKRMSISRHLSLSLDPNNKEPSLPKWKCSLTWHNLVYFFFFFRTSRSTSSKKRKNARNESVEDDNWEKTVWRFERIRGLVISATFYFPL